MVGLLLVLLVLLYVTPAIPGWDEFRRAVTGIDFIKVRRFPTEWLYPLVFAWMTLIVALKHSIWRGWRWRS